MAWFPAVISCCFGKFGMEKKMLFLLNIYVLSNPSIILLEKFLTCSFREVTLQAENALNCVIHPHSATCVSAGTWPSSTLCSSACPPQRPRWWCVWSGFWLCSWLSLSTTTPTLMSSPTEWCVISTGQNTLCVTSKRCEWLSLGSSYPNSQQAQLITFQLRQIWEDAVCMWKL